MTSAAVRERLLAAVAFVAVVATGVALRTGDGSERESDAPAGHAVVRSITDGDTFRTDDDRRVRFIGIDTPEVDDDACFAAEATAHLEQLIPPGTEVRLVADVDPVDRFGRTLAYVHRVADDLDVGLEMAADGYALQLTVPPNVDRADEIGAAVAAAREAGRGLWSAC